MQKLTTKAPKKKSITAFSVLLCFLFSLMPAQIHQAEGNIFIKDGTTVSGSFYVNKVKYSQDSLSEVIYILNGNSITCSQQDVSANNIKIKSKSEEKEIRKKWTSDQITKHHLAKKIYENFKEKSTSVFVNNGIPNAIATANYKSSLAIASPDHWSLKALLFSAQKIILAETIPTSSNTFYNNYFRHLKSYSDTYSIRPPPYFLV